MRCDVSSTWQERVSVVSTLSDVLCLQPGYYVSQENMCM